MTCFLLIWFILMIGWSPFLNFFFINYKFDETFGELLEMLFQNLRNIWRKWHKFKLLRQFSYTNERYWNKSKTLKKCFDTNLNPVMQGCLGGRSCLPLLFSFDSGLSSSFQQLQADPAKWCSKSYIHIKQSRRIKGSIQPLPKSQTANVDCWKGFVW